MKTDCDIIQDLLPLYAEDHLSAKSRALVEEHLPSCAACQQKLAQLQAPDQTIIPAPDPLQRFKHSLRRHKVTAAAFAAFAAAAVLILAWGLFFLQPGDEMGYSLLCFYFFLPLAAFSCSWVLGTHPAPIKWLAPLIFGSIGGLLPYAIFHTTDTLFILFACVPSLVGLLLGTALQAFKKKPR